MAKIPSLKGKPKYLDAPRFPLIYDYEGAFKLDYKKVTKNIVTGLSTAMSKILSKK